MLGFCSLLWGYICWHILLLIRARLGAVYERQGREKDHSLPCSGGGISYTWERVGGAFNGVDWKW
jgi:hypothetical protein